MAKVAGIKERETGKVALCSMEEFGLVRGDTCVFEGPMGLDLGVVVTDTTEIEEQYIADERGITIIRKATAEDLSRVEEISQKEKAAFEVCRKKISQRNLAMRLVRVKYMLDLNRAIFFFTAENRIDFRELVRDLAAEFRCRIEMKQIGVRDKARMIGSLAGCGRALCCCSFLRKFETVSIKMAKEQDLTLIPTKISGMCGRLMCCLMYEYDNYMKIKARVPKIGKKVQTIHGPGRVQAVNIMRETIVVELEDGRRLDFKLPEEADKDAPFSVVDDGSTIEEESQLTYDNGEPVELLESLKKLEDSNESPLEQLKEVAVEPPNPPVAPTLPTPPPATTQPPRPQPEKSRQHSGLKPIDRRPFGRNRNHPVQQSSSQDLKNADHSKQPVDQGKRRRRRPKSKGSDK